MADIGAAARQTGTVRRAAADEWQVLAAVLARAFHDDPIARWIVPDDSRRMEVTEGGFGLYLRKVWLAQDECYTTEGIAGAAVWELPGQWKLGALAQLRLLPPTALTYRRFLPRLMRFLAAAESNHPQERHYYLPFVGVDPQWQGRGIGAALIRPVLERCDAERVPAYLEATTTRNRALYGRHGFEVIEEFKLGKDSPPLWRMWRESPAL